MSATTQRVSDPSGHETILLVEDETSLRRAFARALRGYGYSVIESTDGGDAMLLLEQEERLSDIDLTITDVQMPVKCGPELAWEVRQRRADARFLFMSGCTEIEARHEYEMPPSSPFLEKPFSPRDLAACVRHILDSPAH
jgi:two-component system cell cycle sensor histidine kinase/response regulator CckA